MTTLIFFVHKGGYLILMRKGAHIPYFLMAAIIESMRVFSSRPNHTDGERELDNIEAYNICSFFPQ